MNELKDGARASPFLTNSLWDLKKKSTSAETI